MNENKKSYDLRVKKVLLVLFAASVFVFFSIYMMFFASDKEKLDMFLYDLRFSLRYGEAIIGSLYTCGVFALFIIIYNLELILYKIKQILILSNEGITYYSPEYGKVFISKNQIEDIYITDVKQLKIILKETGFKKSFRAKFWTSLKDMMLGSNPKNVFRINLNFVKCDVDEIRQYLMEYGLDSDSNEANKLVQDLCKKYNISNVNELKNNEIALSECVMELYNTGKLTQKDMAAVTKTNTNKISKIIRKGLSESN